mmetsp:Transcript_34495/g.25592  ORF Transcript_34495/g.25592 Transcript_34495/m.25592 type:complete len:169 (-) Transcript_34495:1755-2261(-)
MIDLSLKDPLLTELILRELSLKELSKKQACFVLSPEAFAIIEGSLVKTKLITALLAVVSRTFDFKVAQLLVEYVCYLHANFLLLLVQFSFFHAFLTMPFRTELSHWLSSSSFLSSFSSQLYSCHLLCSSLPQLATLQSAHHHSTSHESQKFPLLPPLPSPSNLPPAYC